MQYFKKPLFLLFLIFNIFGIQTFAYAKIAIVASKNSHISSLTKEEIEKIFLSKTRESDDGMIIITVQPEKREIQDEFYKKITNKTPSQLKAYWASIIFTGRGEPPRVFKDFKELLEFIANNPRVIGYIPEELVEEDLFKVLMKI